DLPAIQPAIPLIVWLLLAAGVALTGIGAYTEIEKQSQPRPPNEPPPPPREPHLHETWWGLIPFVGSIDQMINGANWWSKAGGAVFLVLDPSLVGGMVAKGIAKGGIVFATRTAVREGLAEVARGGGTAAQREAYAKLVEAAARGEIKLGTQAQIEAA